MIKLSAAELAKRVVKIKWFNPIQPLKDSLSPLTYVIQEDNSSYWNRIEWKFYLLSKSVCFTSTNSMLNNSGLVTLQMQI